MKRIAQKVIARILAWQVRRLYKKHDFKVVAVAGSIGKTSTKSAIANVLGQKCCVQWQEGNYNHPITVPLVFFGLPLPSLFNPFAWALTFLKIESQISQEYPYDIVVIELGTDYPGNLAEFEGWFRADIGVLTAITPEHMEFFKTVDAVAEEELTIARLSDQLVVNVDLCDKKYLKGLEYISYGESEAADYRLTGLKPGSHGFDFTIEKDGRHFLTERHASTAKTQLVSLTAAVTVADLLGLKSEAIRKGLDSVAAVSGRMQRLEGIKQSIILDDTYNASPEATRAALDTLYGMTAPQKIALLGNMNELGEYSALAHKDIGEYCEPGQLDLLVTLGVDANEYLAAAAENMGCTVVRTETPLDAAKAIKKQLQPEAIILAKGSQNGVFAEEAVKKLLAHPEEDSPKLVRQSQSWIKKKQQWLGPL